MLLIILVDSYAVNRDMYRQRRQDVRLLLPRNSVAVFFSAPTSTCVENGSCAYHYDDDLYYLTGIDEPHAMLLIFADEQKFKGEILYVQPKSNQGNGHMGIDQAKKRFGVQTVLRSTEFLNTTINFNSFDRILFNDIPDNTLDTNLKGDLHELVVAFRNKTNFPDNFDAGAFAIYNKIRDAANGKPLEEVVNIVNQELINKPELSNNKLLLDFVYAGEKERRKILQELPSSKLSYYPLQDILNKMREIKHYEEIKLVQRAVDITTSAMNEAIKAVRVGMDEKELEGVAAYMLAQQGVNFSTLPRIASGGKGCNPSYSKNNGIVKNADLVELEFGGKYRGYVASITRTVPAGGNFTDGQSKLYEVLRAAQADAIASSKPGSKFITMERSIQNKIDDGLVSLGIISSSNSTHSYITGIRLHTIGLERVDRSLNDDLKMDMVVEIGASICIPEGSKCDPKWWGMEMSLSDMIVITTSGYKLLTKNTPKRVTEIQELMQQNSQFDAIRR